MNHSIDRRQFLKGAAGVALAATSLAGVEGAPKREKLIGIQIGAV